MKYSTIAILAGLLALGAACGKDEVKPTAKPSTPSPNAAARANPSEPAPAAGQPVTRPTAEAATSERVQEKPAAGTTDEVPGAGTAEAAEPTVRAASAAPAIDPALAKRLEQAFGQTHCLLKRRMRTGLAEIYKATGFADSAAFAAEFAKARQLDPSWAELLMARMVTMDCSKPVLNLNAKTQ